MLNGKVALVTGASRGIGREIAITLGKYGADVIVNYNGSKDKAEEVVAEIVKNGGSAKAVQFSVGNFEESGAKVAELLVEYGHIDILINNAGITKDNLIMKMTSEDFEQVVSTNLTGSFHMIKHLYRAFLKQRSGRIVNLTSISGIIGNPGQANYSASKAGIIGLTKSVAKELASRNITVNAVAPGFIDTEMTQVLSETAKETIVEQIPLKRIGTTVDIAETVAFLVSDKASYITGQIISVDGGMNM